MLTSGAIAIAGLLLLAGGSQALPSARCHSVRAPGLRAGALHLALRGGADADAPGYPSYSSPAAAAVNWDEPAADIPPAPLSNAYIPPAPQMAPPKAPPPPPPATTFQAPPSPVPPAPDAVAWDQSSVSGFRRYMDVFGWDNVSPVVYLLVGLGFASLKAIWHNRGGDDEELVASFGRK
ncbi:hypothetical protein T484DRAFT_1851027 [Baffinella frigidus]|nr:hypothetical protein T484DRAFT_1851027 [Cryptophyta sp. CCMP2293]